MARGAQLARIQGAAVLLQCAAALAWLLWRWQASPGQAVAGAFAVVALVPAVFALELLLLALVDTAAPGGRPPLREMVRAWWSETRCLVPVFYWRQPFRWRAVPDAPRGAGRTGVVLVHGFLCNRGFWAPWMLALRARGIPCVAVNLEPVFGPIDAYAGTIGEAVERLAEATGRPPVVVAHSMGGLAVRAWLQHAAPGACARVVTIGTPHRGTWLARFSTSPNARQMRRDSPWLARLAEAEARMSWRPPFTCWWANCDNIVFPVATATLPDADNRGVRGAAHVDLAFHAEVLAGTLALVEQANCVTTAARLS